MQLFNHMLHLYHTYSFLLYFLAENSEQTVTYAAMGGKLIESPPVN